MALLELGGDTTTRKVALLYLGGDTTTRKVALLYLEGDTTTRKVALLYLAEDTTTRKVEWFWWWLFTRLRGFGENGRPFIYRLRFKTFLNMYKKPIGRKTGIDFPEQQWDSWEILGP